jgi:hypothetical protein
MASSIVLADAQATPVNHTFTPVGLDAKGTYWFEDSSAPNAIGNWRISVEIQRPPVAAAKQNSEGRTFRYKVGVHEPVLETLSNSTSSGILPAPTISYVMRSYHEFVMPERSSLLDRKNLRKMSAGVLGDAQILGIIENLTYVQ